MFARPFENFHYLRSVRGWAFLTLGTRRFSLLRRCHTGGQCRANKISAFDVHTFSPGRARSILLFRWWMLSYSTAVCLKGAIMKVLLAVAIGMTLGVLMTVAVETH